MNATCPVHAIESASERSFARTSGYACSASLSSPRSDTSANPACAGPLIIPGARNGPASSGVRMVPTAGSRRSGSSARCIASWKAPSRASSVGWWKTATNVVSTERPWIAAAICCACSNSVP